MKPTEEILHNSHSAAQQYLNLRRNMKTDPQSRIGHDEYSSAVNELIYEKNAGIKVFLSAVLGINNDGDRNEEVSTQFENLLKFVENGFSAQYPAPSPSGTYLGRAKSQDTSRE